MSIIITLVIFTVIVVIHEWGHFIAAKKCNVYVEEFAVGMGPKLFGVKKGDTLYTVRLLPVGGFCRMSDEDPPDKDKIGFNEANVWQRMLIAAAGPFMNFVLALVILTFMAMATGISTNTVASLIEGYPAQAAGIEAGDRIVKVNGKNVSIRSDLDFYLSQHEGESLDIVLRRNGHNVNVQLVPKLAEDGRYLIGVRTEQKAPLVDIGYNSEAFRGVPKASFFECVRDGCCSMVFLVKITAYGLKEMFTMQVSMDEVSGPIGVTTVVDESYKGRLYICLSYNDKPCGSFKRKPRCYQPCAHTGSGRRQDIFIPYRNRKEKAAFPRKGGHTYLYRLCPCNGVWYFYCNKRYN